MWKCSVLTPKRHASVGVSHVKIGSTAEAIGPWKDFAYKQRKELIKKKLVVTLAICGEVTHGATLTKRGEWADTVDLITMCNSWTDSPLRGVSLVRGVLFSPIDLRYRSCNTGHNDRETVCLKKIGPLLLFQVTPTNLVQYQIAPTNMVKYQQIWSLHFRGH